MVKNVWLTFNLLGNYIGNKNLKPGGRPEKFVAWLDAVRVAYPKNPYMLLFAGLGRILMGVPVCGRTLLEDARVILEGSPNWQYRFARFGLDELLNRVPEEPRELHDRLAGIWDRCVPLMRPKQECAGER